MKGFFGIKSGIDNNVLSYHFRKSWVFLGGHPFKIQFLYLCNVSTNGKLRSFVPTYVFMALVIVLHSSKQVSDKRDLMKYSNQNGWKNLA